MRQNFCRIFICAVALLLAVLFEEPMPTPFICKLESYPYPGPAVYHAKTGKWYDMEPEACTQLTITVPYKDPTLRELRTYVCEECAHKLLDLSGSLFLYVPDRDYLIPLEDDFLISRSGYSLVAIRNRRLNFFTVTSIRTKKAAGGDLDEISFLLADGSS